MSSYGDNVYSLLMAIQNFYLIYVQLFIFHFLSALFFGGGGVISVNLGDKEGPPKKVPKEEGGSSYTTGATSQIPPAPP